MGSHAFFWIEVSLQGDGAFLVPLTFHTPVVLYLLTSDLLHNGENAISHCLYDGFFFGCRFRTLEA